MDKLLETAREHLSDTALENVADWLEKPKYAEYRDELVQMIEGEKWQAIEDAFFKVIEFGTAGRRGTTGVGSNRINRVTVGESAEALCQYMKQIDKSSLEKGIVIAYDTRLSSDKLSRHVASVCVANGFKTYRFESFRSTPELSFAVRHLGCAAGIVITASHNPPSDNGFKAYWSDGCQLVAPHDKGVLDMASKLQEIHVVDYEKALQQGTIEEIGAEVDEAYIDVATAEAVGTTRNISIIYSPLHGAGQRNTLPVLRAAGFADVRPVEEQMVPDGNFPTIPDGRPNPENIPANQMTADKMLDEKADIAITNDPDADRIGVMARHHEAVVYFNGNQASALAAEYILKTMQAQGSLTPEHYVAKTIVTTDLHDAIAEYYGVKCYGNLLVGFKYIGELIRNKENSGEKFVMGSEESFGMLKGDYARDKDGATGALPLAEYAAELKEQGKTLWDAMLDLYRKYGLYVESLENIMFPGAKGFADMKQIMQSLRDEPPREIAGHTVTALLDYNSLERKDVVGNTSTSIDCASGDVIVLEFNGDKRRRITIRPSGTEPKIKIYAQWYEEAGEDVATQYELAQQKLKQLTGAFDALTKGESA
ncbi:MAG: phospho-sugar mutase [Spartobacteria bacterium]|nr:phospho-sugar mutase [Spartobacteria bacterium]NCU30047.1 phospho-sugar mutase [Candidatus Saccharibacteria bacterium]